jgi:hypothetical protein
MKVRPALSKTFGTPFHASHMEPSCTERDSRGSASVPEGSSHQSRNTANLPEHVSTDDAHWLPPLSIYVSLVHVNKMSI